MFHIGQETLVALDQHALFQRFEAQQGIAWRNKAGHGASRRDPMVPRRPTMMRPLLGVSMARSLTGISLVVTLGTLLSKVGGLGRQLVIAAAFGVGAAYDAYNYAYVLPGFLLILLGGINGPFHSAMVSVLSRRPREEGAYILTALNTSVSALLLLVTVVLVLAADPLITLVGPGLSPELHAIAKVQLQVMAPMALLAGLIGLGFGSLNAADEFWIPAVSPLMSSAALVVGVGLLWWQLGSAIVLPASAMTGGVVLAAATLVGALLQWLIQLPALIREGLGPFSAGLGLAASRRARGLAGDGTRHPVLRHVADQRVHGSVLRFRHCGCSSGSPATPHSSFRHRWA